MPIPRWILRWLVPVTGGLNLLLAPAVYGQVLAAPCWRGQPLSTFQEWTFATAANPAVPDRMTNAFGPASATIRVGDFGAGWLPQLEGFGSATGFWDLGRAGTVTVVVDGGSGTPLISHRYVSIQVVQWYDGGIYDTNALVRVDQGTYLGGSRQIVEPTAFGSWMRDQTLWRLPADPASRPIVITAAYNGSAVDQITVDTLALPNPGPINLVLEVALGLESQTQVNWSLAPLEACGYTNISCVPASGAAFPLGTHPVICTAQDFTGYVVTYPFTVTLTETVPLRLRAERVSGSNDWVRLSWPISYATYILEQAPALTPALSWSRVETPVAVYSDQCGVVVPTAGRDGYFRLRKP